jgi:uncharacterized membrane protein HdeD (DUF308 family)
MFATDFTPDRLELEALEPVREHWGWLLAVGVACLALGFVGLGYSVLLTITSTALFGVLVLVAGGLQLWHASGVSGWKARTGYGALGVLSLAAAVVIFLDPLAASVWLTLFIAAFLLAGAVVRTVLFFQLRESAGRGWLLVGAVAGGVLGVLLFLGWPFTGLWFIGVAVAIDLMLGGVFWIATALRARRLANGEFATTQA